MSENMAGLKIVDYDAEYDQKLLELFYRSVYGTPTYKQDKGSDYVRVPNKWIYRYALFDEYITKIAKKDDNIIASLGVVVREGKVNGKTMKIGCFMDNCILPEYLGSYESIFSGLFKEMEDEATDREISVICGWDFYQTSIGEHRKLFESLGYSWVEDVSWYIGGSAIEGQYPYPWDATKISSFWRLGFRFLKYYYKLKEKLTHKLPEDITIRSMEDTDIGEVCNLINNGGDKGVFAPEYSEKELRKIVKKNNIHGLVAVKNSKIVGVLTYMVTAWSGQMFGKPYYTQNWQTTFGFLPDEFAILDQYRDTSLPTNMVFELARIENPEKETKHDNYCFISDVIQGIKDTRWRRKAFLNFGCMKPDVGYGVILAKSLRDDIELDTNKIWHLPARYIVAPVPSSSYFQKQGQ